MHSFTSHNYGKIFITGSANGLGLLSAQALLHEGHEIVLHARNAVRRREVLNKVTSVPDVLIGDLSNMKETINLAEQVNALGAFDAIIHKPVLPSVWRRDFCCQYTSTLYAYLAFQKPKRLIYLSSGMHLQGRSDLDHIKKDINNTSYSDSELHVLAIAKAISKTWTDVFANAVNPGWVPTKMAAKVLLMISKKATKHRYGWRQVTRTKQK